MTTIRHLNIEVTRRCDQQCGYCFNDSGPSARYPEMTVDRWVTFIRHMSLRGLRSLHITGGEPFVSSATVPLLREAQALGISTSVLSNGLHIPAVTEREPGLFRKLLVAQISLDSMDASVNDVRRGKKSAKDQAIAAIEVLRKLSVEVEISCTVDQNNIAHVDDVAAYARSIQASLILRPVVWLGRATPHSDRASSSAMDRLVHQHADILVCDRFVYVPSGPYSDRHALEAGILTMLPNGQFRSGPIACPGFPALASSAAELLEAA